MSRSTFVRYVASPISRGFLSQSWSPSIVWRIPGFMNTGPKVGPAEIWSVLSKSNRPVEIDHRLRIHDRTLHCIRRKSASEKTSKVFRDLSDGGPVPRVPALRTPADTRSTTRNQRASCLPSPPNSPAMPSEATVAIAPMEPMDKNSGRPAETKKPINKLKVFMGVQGV